MRNAVNPSCNKVFYAANLSLGIRTSLLVGTVFCAFSWSTEVRLCTHDPMSPIPMVESAQLNASPATIRWPILLPFTWVLDTVLLNLILSSVNNFAIDSV